MAVLLDNFVQASAEMEREQQEREHQDKTRTDTVPPPRTRPHTRGATGTARPSLKPTRALPGIGSC